MTCECKYIGKYTGKYTGLALQNRHLLILNALEYSQMLFFKKCVHMHKLRKRIWTLQINVNSKGRFSYLLFFPRFAGGIQSSWRCLQTRAAVQEASKASSDGQLLSEGCSCLLESWELLIPCMHSPSIVCVVKGTETYNDNRGTLEVSTSWELFFVCTENLIFPTCWGKGPWREKLQCPYEKGKQGFSHWIIE